MKVVFAVSEAFPFVKVGGLADVAGSLPRALAALGVEVTVVMPLWANVDRVRHGLRALGEPFDVPLGDEQIAAQLHAAPTWVPEAEGPSDGEAAALRAARAAALTEAGWGPAAAPVGGDHGSVRHIFVENARFFERDDPYAPSPENEDDRAKRYIFFSRAVLEIARRFDADIVHANDWCTALVPVFLKEQHHPRGDLAKLRTVLTIHNLAYQGRFWALDWHLLDLAGQLFNHRALEFYGDINFLKGGIVWADHITTVSPTYAEEIRTPAYGCGLEGVLVEHGRKLSGILNGIDGEVWNPSIDAWLDGEYSGYDADHLDRKSSNKAVLQRELGLAVDPNRPLLALIGRLQDQKGIFLVQEILEWLIPRRGVQMVVLGQGERHYEEWFASMAREHPQALVYRGGVDEALAHRTFAAADLFLMPSAFEPCGLTQMYALRYGAIPVVHNTGGLRDTVVDLQDDPERGTGFKMAYFSGQCLFDMVTKGLDLMRDGAAWDAARRRGMAQDFSWRRSAEEYLRIYRRLSEEAAAATTAAAARTSEGHDPGASPQPGDTSQG